MLVGLMMHGSGSVRRILAENRSKPAPSLVAGAAVVAVLSLAACSGSSGAPTASTSAGSSASAATPGPVQATTSAAAALPSPAARVRAPEPQQVDGYTYSAATAAAKKKVAALARQNRQVVNAVTVRKVRKGNALLGDLVVISLDRKYVDSEIFRDQLVATMAAGLAGPGAQVTKKVIKKQALAVADGKVNVAAFYRSRKIVVIAGPNPLADLTRFAVAYARAG